MEEYGNGATVSEIEGKYPSAWSDKPLQLKIIYWGPGESGKTTNYRNVIKVFNDGRISKGFEISTTDGRTLWSDSVHLATEFVMGGRTLGLIIHIVTCTGQERFLATREYVVGGADGIIFVADSSPDKMEENLRSFRELSAFVSGKNIPILIQLNKRDLEDAVSEEHFRELMGLPFTEKDAEGFPILYPAVALNSEDAALIFVDMLCKILIKKFGRG